jgi:hypothetical protein
MRVPKSSGEHPGECASALILLFTLFFLKKKKTAANNLANILEKQFIAKPNI